MAYFIYKSSALGKEKYVIVAYCEDDDNESKGYCEFETSIIPKKQDIYLVEDEIFSKYVVKEEQGVFRADIQSGRQIQRLTIDIMIYSGDVTFNCYGNSPEKYEEKEDNKDYRDAVEDLKKYLNDDKEK